MVSPGPKGLTTMSFDQMKFKFKNIFYFSSLFATKYMNTTVSAELNADGICKYVNDVLECIIFYKLESTNLEELRTGKMKFLFILKT